MASRTDPARADLEQEVIRLKREGLSQRAIGERLGISQRTAGRYLGSGLDRIVAPEVQQIRAQSYQRLSNVLPAYEKRAAKGDDKAAVTMVKVDESIRKLYGADVTRAQEDAAGTAALLEKLPDAVAETFTHAFLVARTGDLKDYGWLHAMQGYGPQYLAWIVNGRPEPRPAAPVWAPPDPAPAPEPGVIQPSAVMPGPDSDREFKELIEKALRQADEMLGGDWDNPPKEDA